jgi:hypothetical protein
MISLKPSTLKKIERLSAAAGKPIATVITDFVEEGENWFVVGSTMLEKINSARTSALHRGLRNAKAAGGS